LPVRPSHPRSFPQPRPSHSATRYVIAAAIHASTDMYAN
jgi:hypothetical protein